MSTNINKIMMDNKQDLINTREKNCGETHSRNIKSL
jgi:hypothetical protein